MKIGHPLAEVFGFPPDNFSDMAERYRINRLCPYNNKVPSCTKDKALDPLGVCSVTTGEDIAITCPIRFRQDWLVIEDAAKFFFKQGVSWTSLQEIKLKDANGISAGNIDFVLAAYDEQDRIIDFGSLEIQSVYISGNIRMPFHYYMEDRKNRSNMTWTQTNVRPDYLSSSRKRLVPQMIYKGSILKSWNKKQVVALHKPFFETIPNLPVVEPEQADIAWMIYELNLDKTLNQYNIEHIQTVYTCFEHALEKIVTPAPGPINDFIDTLQKKLDEKLNNQPDAPALNDIINC
ncbi:Restriction endonuclease domain-containing protein [Desulfonema limicola]|uniref:Restriction endonuclease domain-containing protein n=1 Tax=Desulfonema limicola TaxID=45656 RepID=A0A975BF85_9BACT|nr:NotI family restriction endonuclease [Desulfonema limicola]QTA83980.1 Restriction endonuclease domain-containing protein [Desulfonema limicola]